MKRLAIAYVAALHLAVGLMLVKPYAVAFKIAGDEPVRESHIRSVRAAHLSGDSLVPAGAVVFFGDSITMGLPVSAVSHRAVNYGISWQRSDHLLKSIGSYGSLSRAGAVVLMIGTNDVLQGKVAGIEDRYRAIAAAIPGRLLMVSPPPIGRETHTAALQQARAAARKVCEEHPRCTFVDGFAALSFPNALQQDRIHPTPAGYAALIQLLRNGLHVTPMRACWS